MASIKLENIEEREIIEGYRCRFVHSDTMTFASWNVEAGRSMPEHFHPHEQISSVLEGRFELTIEGETQLLEPGVVLVIPSNAVHSGKAITDCKIIDTFSPVREDYKFE